MNRRERKEKGNNMKEKGEGQERKSKGMGRVRFSLFGLL